jgi:hypothetical protein
MALPKIRDQRLVASARLAKVFGEQKVDGALRTVFVLFEPCLALLLL